jgi:hypothetical protein
MPANLLPGERVSIQAQGVFALAQTAEPYGKMLSGNARFRVVITTGN